MSERLGPLDLLVVQPTPFCNLDCSYCYLPDRGSKRRIRPGTLERIFERVFESDLVTRPFTVVWHAGEPLVLPPSFYEDAFATAARFARPGAEITHSFQTNGTLIDDTFCDLMLRHDVRVGVSVDGPAFLHDATRKTRSGKGTHARVMVGIERLQRHAVPFHVISVLTRDALDYPDELHEFYVEHGIEQVGFNVEEIEGPNERSSLSAQDAVLRYRQFMSRFFDLAMGSEPQLKVREFGSMIAAVLHAGEERGLPSQEAAPFAIVSVDCEGNFATFSPELLGLPSDVYSGFALGNVMQDSFADAAASARFRAMARDVAAGVSKCRESCAWFRFCGGGAPGNKYFENGSFDSTETMFCRLHRQALADVVLSKTRRPEATAAHVA
jgi:uncharacterized protein